MVRTLTRPTGMVGYGAGRQQRILHGQRRDCDRTENPLLREYIVVGPIRLDPVDLPEGLGSLIDWLTASDDADRQTDVLRGIAGCVRRPPTGTDA